MSEMRFDERALWESNYNWWKDSAGQQPKGYFIPSWPNHYSDARKRAIDERGLASLKEDRRKGYAEQYLQKLIPDMPMEQLSPESEAKVKALRGQLMLGKLGSNETHPWSQSWEESFTKWQENQQKLREHQALVGIYDQAVKESDFKKVLDPYGRGKRSTGIIMDEIPKMSPEQVKQFMDAYGWGLYDPQGYIDDAMATSPPEDKQWDELDFIR